MPNEWFLEAMKNAVAAGHMSEGGAERVKKALHYVEPDEFVCLICSQDCRDAFGGASRACRAEYNAD